MCQPKPPRLSTATLPLEDANIRGTVSIPAGALEGNSVDWLSPVALGPSTIAANASKGSTLKAVIEILSRLEQDELIEFTLRYYKEGLSRYGNDWGFMDQLTVLHAASSLVVPHSYLEIGVLRGRSLAVVASRSPQCELVGFDLWAGEYAGLPNPGIEHVKSQLLRVGHKASATFTEGDSAETVPAWLDSNPGQRFDLVTVDGDHSEDGARRDLVHTLPRVRLGGVVVMDDIVHPRCAWLERVWDEVMAANPQFVEMKFKDIGNGVAFAVKRAETVEPPASTRAAAESPQSVGARLREEESHRRNLNSELSSAREELRLVGEDRDRKGEVVDRLEAELREVREDQSAKKQAIQAMDAELGDQGRKMAALTAEVARVRDVVADLRGLVSGRHEQQIRMARELGEYKSLAWGLPALVLRRKRSMERWLKGRRRDAAGAVAEGTEAASRRKAGPTLRVGIDALQIQFGRSGGVETYLRVLLQAIPLMSGVAADVLCTPDQEGGLSKYVDEHIALRALGEDFNPIRQARASRARLMRSTAPQVAFVDPSFARLGDGLGLDLLHSPVQVFTSMDFDIPGILNLHDLQHLYYPENFTPGDLEAREKFYARSVALASAIVVSSNHVRDSLVTRMQVPSNRVYVIPVACNPEIEMGLRLLSPEAAREMYALPTRFAFFPAQFWPHKNHTRLVEALAILRRRNPDHDLRFVFSGSREFSGWPATRDAIERNKLEGAIRILDFIPTEHLGAIYKSALFCIVPSLFEASSYPVIEAQNLGCPAMCSNVTSLPELMADGCGLVFDPLSPEDIADKMEAWLTQTQTRLDAGMRGQARARRENSLSSYAARLASLYESVVAQVVEG